MAYIPH